VNTAVRGRFSSGAVLSPWRPPFPVRARIARTLTRFGGQQAAQLTRGASDVAAHGAAQVGLVGVAEVGGEAGQVAFVARRGAG